MREESSGSSTLRSCKMGFGNKYINPGLFYEIERLETFRAFKHAPPAPQFLWPPTTTTHNGFALTVTELCQMSPLPSLSIGKTLFSRGSEKNPNEVGQIFRPYFGGRLLCIGILPPGHVSVINDTWLNIDQAISARQSSQQLNTRGRSRRAKSAQFP